MRHRRGFTLVELLVVIGIIALLLSILLPSLQAARRSANAVKCAATMREIGRAWMMYALDHKDWTPVAQWNGSGATPSTYELWGDTYPVSGTYPYWPSFLAPYVTSTKQGTASGTDGAAATAARNSVFWGCPTWDGYESTAPGGRNRVQTGYGMNLWPTAKANQATNFPPTSERNFINHVSGQPVGSFHKSAKWTQPTERALIADSRFWIIEANPAPADGNIPGQNRIDNSNTYTPGVAGQTMFDFYRHGLYPPISRTNGLQFEARGGKVAFNILYVDGHVVTTSERADAYRSVRMKFPG